MRYILRFMFVAGITATAACQEAPPAVTPGSPDDAAAFPALDARTRISPSRGSVAISDRRDGWARDGHEVNAVSIAGDTLTVEVSYGGGCRDHSLTLVLAESFIDGSPVSLHGFLAHDSNGDPCEAWLTETSAFDLGAVKARYRQTYGSGPGSILLLLEGDPGTQAVYRFGQ